MPMQFSISIVPITLKRVKTNGYTNSIRVRNNGAVLDVNELKATVAKRKFANSFKGLGRIVAMFL